MQLPEIVKQVGKANGRERVYLEDYVYTYLRELKKEAGILPGRAALFGHVYHKNSCNFYMIYGAASVIGGLERGRGEEQVRKEFFEDYELIGYVNIYAKGREMPGKKEGCYIFYEKNEPMQNYLLSCYEQKNKEQGSGKKTRKSGRKGGQPSSMKSTAKRFFYGGCVILLAIAVTTINDYNKMHGFVEAAGRAVAFAEAGR